MRCFRIVVRPDPQETDAAQGCIEAVDAAAARAMLPKSDGLMPLDHSKKRTGRGLANPGAMVIDQAREAQGGARRRAVH